MLINAEGNQVKTYLDQLDSNVVEFFNFGIHRVRYAGFLRNSFVLDFRVQIRNEPANRWAFNEAK